MSRAPEPLEATHSVRRRRHTVSVGGDLDHLAAPRLEALSDGVIAEHPARLVLDLRDVTFIDQDGLAAVLNINRAAELQRCPLKIVAAGPGVHRAFALRGLVGVLPWAAPSLN